MQDCSNAVITHESSTLSTELSQQNLSSNSANSAPKKEGSESVCHSISDTLTPKKETDSLDSCFVKRWADEEDDDIYDVDDTIQCKNNVIDSNTNTNSFQTKKIAFLNSPLSNNRYRNSPQQRSPNNYWKSGNSNSFQYKDNSYKADQNSIDAIWNHKKAKELKPKFKSETSFTFNENLTTFPSKQHLCRTLENSCETLSPTCCRSDTMMSPKTHKAHKPVVIRKPTQSEFPQNWESTNVKTIVSEKIHPPNANKSAPFRKPHRYVELEGLIAQLNDSKTGTSSTIGIKRNVSIFGTGKPRDEPQQTYALSTKDSKSEKSINTPNSTV